ncbi:MAG: sigma-54 dependent transcriptional regulator [Spirochaetaceae bacterium]|jgi:DNA-binding NtrC family response regulator|nr:sigma-54 dependent transcriptional regulator [Spirochaetaceae bacterium]
MKFTILVVDDEKNIRSGLAAALELEDYNVAEAEDGNAGWKRFQKGDIDLVITDLKMPGLSGEELLRRISSETPGVPVIVLTGHGTVENAVEAMRDGAYDFLTKPLNIDHLNLIVKRALENRQMVLRQRELEEKIAKKNQFNEMIGNSAPMCRIFDTISRVAPSKASVLITGESGVGKELVADSIHALSPRKDAPIIKVHCAALAASLLESELFGHEKGAFTGAIARRRGCFERANGGTLFLDEIGEIEQNVQIKLLRVLQEKKFERVGGEETIETDVRIIAATNRDLKEEISKGNFREDLFFRLNVVNIFVPPLKERKEDIPLMVASFIKTLSEENGKQIEGIDDKARAILYNYDWPGNVRELRNCIESAVVMARTKIITADDLPPTLLQSSSQNTIAIPFGISMEDAQKIIINETIAWCKGNKSKAADSLGIGRKTLHRKE